MGMNREIEMSGRRRRDETRRRLDIGWHNNNNKLQQKKASEKNNTEPMWRAVCKNSLVGMFAQVARPPADWGRTSPGGQGNVRV